MDRHAPVEPFAAIRAWPPLVPRATLCPHSIPDPPRARVEVHENGVIMRSRISNIATAGALSATAAAVGGVATDPHTVWYRSLDLPPWQPPGIAFPLVWTGLYASITGAAGQAVTAYEQQGRHEEAKATWRALVVNLVLSAGWSVTFFGRHRVPAATGIAAALAASSWELSHRAGRADPRAGRALVPYAAWCTFATALTADIWRRNR